jgi:hypothetical protein
LDRRLLHRDFGERSPERVGMGAPRAAFERVSDEEARESAAAAATEAAGTRCEAVLKNGERCKRDGESVLDGRSGRSLYYCFVHRKMLREKGLLLNGGEASRE